MCLYSVNFTFVLVDRERAAKLQEREKLSKV